MLRSFVFLAAACLVTATAAAQQQPTAPPVPDPSANAQQANDAASQTCSSSKLDKAIDANNIDFIVKCQEAFKLQAENEQLQKEAAKFAAETETITQRNKDRILDFVIVFGPLLGAIVALFPIGLGYLWKHSSEKQLLESENNNARAARREEYTLGLMKELSEREPSRQSFATAGLVSMVRENLDDKKKHTAAEADRHREAITIVAALFARLRDETLELPEAKYIADELGKIFRTMPKKSPPFQVKDFNLQLIHMSKTYWADVNVSDADLFEATLIEVGFRRAKLIRTVFKDAVLHKAVFAGADLEGADLRGAQLTGAALQEANNLSSARFSKETTYDRETTWPSGFDPRAAGLTEVEVPVEQPA